MDEMVYQTQRWLNKTYGDNPGYNKLDLDNPAIKGKTGWPTIYALTRALQIELGITDTADNFGPTSRKLYAENPLCRNDGVKNNKYGILQGALWCKGYNPGHYYSDGVIDGYSRVFDEKVENAVKKLQSDAGILNPDGMVSVNFMAALLSMDSFILLSNYGGDTHIREYQQLMNRTYEDYIGIMPCDGIYGRNTNRAFIYAIQAEEGLPVSVANGNFGPTTQRCCPTIPYAGVERSYSGKTYNTNQINQFTSLFKFGLYVNGFGDGNFEGSLSTGTIKEFQQFMALPVTGKADLTTWMSVAISCGDTSRSALAADCATILTQEKAQTLVNNGYQLIGRYLTGVLSGGISKALSDNEITIILEAGLRLFPIYQTSARSDSYFTPEQGTEDAKAAINAASGFRIPYQTIIYFAVDFDAMDYQITNNIIPYFKNVYEYFKEQHMYRVGIYGARNICSKVSAAGYSTSSFVGDMSTGFSGNLGFKIPDDWAFDQFTTVTIGSGSGLLEIDKDGYSGRDTAVSYRFAKPVEGGSGDGIIQINRSGKDMQVYAGREFGSPGVWKPVGSPIGVIPHNGFFVYKNHSQSEPLNQRCFRVLYTDVNGNPGEGYVYEGYNLFGNDIEYEEIWKAKQDFMNFKCNETNTGLVNAKAVNILGAMCTTYTLSDSTPVFTSPGGDYVATLPKGTQIGISGNSCGVSRPYLLFVQRIFNAQTGAWEKFNKFIDLRFDLGNMPHNRLLR